MIEFFIILVVFVISFFFGMYVGSQNTAKLIVSWANRNNDTELIDGLKRWTRSKRGS